MADDDPKQPSAKDPAGSSQASPKPFMSRTLLEHLNESRAFVRATLNLHEDANIQGTIDTIRKDMVFRGHVVWVLVCSIFIASIGLDTNSAAVIIGAMLISPLMGPILAVGLAVGTNDSAMLRLAMKNVWIMVIVSLATSTVYFMITPFGNADSELLSRTAPTLLDAFIGFFGGLAGIIGVSRRDRGNVVPGVAIATALMPPLCTAGYGLATLNWQYFFGAFYLFLLNSMFIATATVMIVRYLHFPMAEYMDVETRRKSRGVIALFVLLALIPSMWILSGAVKRSFFDQRVTTFGVSLQEAYPGIFSIQPRYDPDSARIDVYVLGDGDLTAMRADMVRRRDEAGIRADITLHGERDVTEEERAAMRAGLVEDLFTRNEEKLFQRDSLIANLQNRLSSFARDTVPMAQVSRELAIQHPAVQSFSYGKVINVRGGTVDTIPTLLVNWSDQRAREDEETRLTQWLMARLGLDTVRVISTQ